MKSFCIAYPAKRVTHVRNVERGDELAEDLTTPAGQLLYGSGTNLIMDRLMKIKKFDVKRVPILREREEWVSREELERRRRQYDSVEVVDSRTIPDDEEEPCAEERELLAKSTLESDTPDQMASLIDLLESVSEWPREGDESASRERFQELSDDVGDLKEVFSRVLSGLSREDNPERVTEVLSVLEGLGERLESVQSHDDLSEQLVEQLQDYVDDREQLRSNMLEVIQRVNIPSSDETEQSVREKVSSLRDDTGTDSDTSRDSLGELVEASRDRLQAAGEDDSQGDSVLRDIEDHLDGDTRDEGAPPDRLLELVDELKQLIEQETSDPSDDLADRLTDYLKELLEGFGGDGSPSTEPAVDSPLQRLRGSLTELADGNWEQGLAEFQESLEASERVDVASGDLDESERKLRQLNQRQEEFLDRLEDQLGEEAVEKFRRVLRGEATPDVESWVQSGLTREDMEVFRDLLESRKEWQGQLWDRLRGKFEEILGSLPESERQAVREKLMDVARQVRVKPDRPSDGQDRQPSGDYQEELAVIREAIDDGDHETLSRRSGLPESTVETVRELFVIPEGLNKWQDRFLDPFKEIVDSALFMSVVNHDRVSDYVRRVEDLLDNHKKPLELLIMDPDPGAFLLAHEYNVSILSLLIAEGLGHDQRERERLVSSTALMDTGMAAIPESLFMKDGELSKRGRQEIYKHPLYSEMFAKRAFGEKSPVARIVREHHERRNGEGYPRRLPPDEQHLLTSVLSVADTYAAMLEDRIHRDRLPPTEALEKITNQRDEHRDDAVEVLERRIGFYPNGTVVLLSSGEIGLVRQQSMESPRQPKLLIFTDEDRNKLDVPQPVDLRERDSLRIRRVLKTMLDTGN